MDVNSISGNVVAAQFQALKPAAPTDKPAKGVSSLLEKSPNQTAQLTAVASANATDKVADTGKPSPVVTPVPENKPNHVLVSYNQQGELRTKFMDSNSNVIYQIPSEMVAKIEDQMMKPNTTTSIQG
jgi:hypothetical protein